MKTFALAQIFDIVRLLQGPGSHQGLDEEESVRALPLNL